MAYGGAGFSSRFSLEVQVRLSIADSAVAQIFKIYDELTRELFVYSPAEFRPALAKKLLDDNAILGLAVAKSGRKVDDPWKTVAMPQADGSFLIDGQKIYTTGAAEADYVVVLGIQSAVRGYCRKSVARRPRQPGAGEYGRHQSSSIATGMRSGNAQRTQARSPLRM